jgi:hypothetical protein
MSDFLDLANVRADVLEFCALRQESDLYGSCDIAHMRTVMGEDLQATVPAARRAEWCGFINSFADPDGGYRDRLGHSALHANGMVIGALGALGGRQPHPVRLYDEFDRPETVGPWLGTLAWEKAWSTSHAFWGGVHCFSFSARATPEWLDAAFTWLDANLDPETGWWRRGVPHQDRHQGLGGAVHLLPLYEHHHRPFPYPERVIDSVLALQLPDGSWLAPGDRSARLHVMSYLELDALYALILMRREAPGYREAEILAAARRYGRLARTYYARHAAELYALHPHYVLAAVGTFGGLQQLLPDEFRDTATWTDIFSDRRLYRTARVEQL